MEKTRLDDLLVQRGIAADRKEAAALILSGAVFSGPQRLDKPGLRLPASVEVEVRTRPEDRYASRAGLKLEGALQDLQVSVRGKVCLDVGASTGGFTDCLLQRGARRIHAVDVGRGQLDWRLRNDRRVVTHEGVNARYLEAAQIGEPVDLIVVDVSFISLRLILPPLKQFPGSEILALVKPQFEADRGEIEPGGLVSDPGLQQTIFYRIRSFAEKSGFQVLGETPSPLPGQKGNQERFLYLLDPR